jgi:nucleoside-diphosphate-sugar epimerase
MGKLRTAAPIQNSSVFDVNHYGLKIFKFFNKGNFAVDRSVLIIGGAGYIGHFVIRDLLDRGYKVRCLDLLVYQNGVVVTPFFGNRNFTFMYGDICDVDVLERALDGMSDVVLLAGLVGDPITKKYPDESMSVNDIGIQRCIELLNGKGLRQLIFVSTCSNYGLIANDALANEEFPLAPLSLYARSKVAAELKLINSKGLVDYTPTILRFATAFGMAPRMRFDLTVNEFTRELALDRELLVFDAHTWRPYCHVRDFSRLIYTVLEAPLKDVAFEVFNAGGEQNNFTKKGVVDTIVDLLPNAKVRYKEHGSDPRNYRVDFSKVRKVLGFEPKYSVQYGVAELLNAIENHVFDNADNARNFHGNYEIVIP